MLSLGDGPLVVRTRFNADMRFVEEHPLPAVRAPREGEFCLRRLAAIAAVLAA